MTPEDGERRRRTPGVSQLGSDGPQFGEVWLVQSLHEVFGPGGSPRAGLRSDRALNHFHVPIAPFHEAFIEIDESLGELRDRRILTIHVDQDPLHLRRWLDR